MKRPALVNDHIYHIYNRGVEKRDVFLEEKDYLRFVHDLFEFNDQLPNPSASYFFNRPSLEVGLPKMERRPRKLLVEILVFSLIPNHYHLLLRQKVEKGITEFMRKLGTGYTNYFNQKYKRVGPLFQGKFKAVLINQEAHLIHLPHYIHLNSLDLIAPEWKEKGIRNHQKVLKFLNSYRWSSYLDYISKKNFPSVTSREFLWKCIGQPKEYKKATEQWLKEIDLTPLEEIALE